MPLPPKAPELKWYGLPRLGYDSSVLPLTGDVKKDQVLIESICFRIAHAEHEGGMGRWNHFKNYVDLLWNDPDSSSMKRCVWNPWANRMFLKMCEEPELVIAGPTSAGKSDPVALYALVSYLTDPTHTLVLVLSTTIAGAKKRIWKTMREYWDSVPNLPGKPLWSTNEVRGLNYQGDGYGESSGMYLLASEKSNEKAAMDKLIGLKSPRTGNPGATYEELIAQPEYADLQKHFDEETLRDLIPRLNNLSNDRIGKIVMCVDEATGAVDSLISAVRTNLQPGNVGSFQIIWIGNPANPYDVLGQAARPEVGWDGVDLIKDEEWRTDTGGLCIRFNGELNPRIMEGNERYSWMLRKEDIDKMAKTYGRDSMFYHRMVLGTWCLTGGELGIYSPADIELSGSRRSNVVWGYKAPIPCSFLDPAFTAGGDRAMARFGLCGEDINGEHVILLTESVAIKVDVNNTSVPINYQIVRGWKKECMARGVLPQHAAYDRTGGGIPFGDIVITQWSNLVTGVTSGGPASKNPVPGRKSSNFVSPRNLRLIATGPSTLAVSPFSVKRPKTVGDPLM